MQIPTVDDLLQPILEYMNAQETGNQSDTIDFVSEKFDLSEIELTELVPDSSKTVISTRVKTAFKHLTEAGLVHQLGHNRYEISDRGIEWLANPAENGSIQDMIQPVNGHGHTNGVNGSAASDNGSAAIVNGNGHIDGDSESDSAAIVPAAGAGAGDEQLYNALRSIFVSAGAGANNKVAAPQSIYDTSASNALAISTPKPLARPINVLREERIQSSKGNLSQVELIFMYVLRVIENYYQYPVLYLLPIFIMGVAGVVTLLIQGLEYESSGVVYVQESTTLDVIAASDSDGFAWESAAQVTANELDELLQTQSFMRLIVSQTELESEMTGTKKDIDDLFDELRAAYSINPLGPNQIRIRIIYEDPLVAFQLAEATVNNFIEWQISAEQQDISAARTFLENIVPEYENEYQIAVENLESYLLQNPAPIRGERPEIEELQIERLRQAVSVSDTRYQDALSSLESIRLEEVIIEGKARQKFSVIDRPEIPEETNLTALDIAIQFAIFIIAGIALTVIGILGATLLDRSTNYPIDIRNAVNLPVLAMMPTTNQPVLATPEGNSLE